MNSSTRRGLVTCASTLVLAAAVSLAVPRARAEAAEAAADAPATVAEVIVTAEKRGEKTLDVPMSLTALGGADLVRSASFRLEDFVATVPGLQMVGVGGFGSQLVIRGLTTGTLSVNSSVATYIDETPYTANGSVGLSDFVTPNIDTFDLQRVEVLRGPQGTLYGANALGGLLKYVTNAPDPTHFAAAAEAGINTVDGSGSGHDLHGMVNLPLGDRLALRVVGYSNDAPGFINDPSRGLKDINTASTRGGRASLLFKPTDNLSLRLSATLQRRAFDDAAAETVQPFTLQPTVAPLAKSTLIGNPGHVDNAIYNLTVDYALSWARLVSSTSYTRYDSVLLSDASSLYSPILNPIFAAILGTYVPYGLALPQPAGNHQVTQELRLSSLPDQPLEWQVGAYYADQKGRLDQFTYPIDPTSRQILYNFPISSGGFYFRNSYRETAVFADADWHVTPTFDLAAGGRYSHNDQSFHEAGFGLLGGTAVFGAPSSEGVFTFSTDARWHLQPSVMVYARIAEGFVPGGPNAVIPTADNTVPVVFHSSTTLNYETGVKASLDHGRIVAEVSAFDIEWRKIQLSAAFGGESAVVNGGEARSTGLEWNLGWRPLAGLNLDVNGAYTDAHLTSDTPASVNGHSGDRLPVVPRLSTSVSADYERHLAGPWSGFVGVNWRTTGSRYADFDFTGGRQITPAYSLTDLKAGLATDRWTLTAFVKNAGNTLAINSLSSNTLAGGFGPQSATLYQPRTFGLSLAANW